jgi:acyl carrier protein
MVDRVIEHLRSLIVEKLDVNLSVDKIDPDVSLLDDGLGLDSLAIVELISLSEAFFGVEFGEKELNMETFASLRALAIVVKRLHGEAVQVES